MTSTASAILSIPSYDALKGWLASWGLTTDRIVPFALISVILYIAIRKLIGNVQVRVDCIEKCIVEIQSILRTKHKLQFQQSIANTYGRANSPIVLKEEFKPFVKDSGLEKQIEGEIGQLVEEIKKNNPLTGIDAQKYIEELVLSDRIEKYIDVKSFKQLLYRKGKAVEDYYGILTVFLFEMLIPKLGIPDTS